MSTEHDQASTTNGTEASGSVGPSLSETTQTTSIQWPTGRVGNPHNQSLHEEASHLMHSHLRPRVAKLLMELEAPEKTDEFPNESHDSGWHKHNEARTAIELEEQFSEIFTAEPGQKPLMDEEASLVKGQKWNDDVRELVGLPALEQTEACTSKSASSHLVTL